MLSAPARSLRGGRSSTVTRGPGARSASRRSGIGLPGQRRERTSDSTSSADVGRSSGEDLAPVGGHDDVVLDADADPLEARRLVARGRGAEVQPRLDGEDHARLEDPRGPVARVVAGVVHVEPQPVRRLVWEIRLVGTGVDGVLERPAEDAQPAQALRERGHRGVVDVADPGTGSDPPDRSAPSSLHHVVHRPLQVREAARRRVGARHVPMVEPVLRPGIDQDEVTFGDRRVLAHVVEHTGVRARAHDRLVGGAGGPDPPEGRVHGRLDHPLPHPGPDRGRRRFVATHGDLGGPPHAGQLRFALAQPQLVEDLSRIGDPARSASGSGPASPRTDQRVQHERLDHVPAAQAEVDSIRSAQQVREAKGELAERMTGVRSEALGSPLGPQPRACPALGIGVALPHEELEARLRSAHEDRDRPGLGRARQVVELPVRRVRPLRVPRRILERGRGEHHRAPTEPREGGRASALEDGDRDLGELGRRHEAQASDTRQGKSPRTRPAAAPVPADRLAGPPRGAASDEGIVRIPVVGYHGDAWPVAAAGDRGVDRRGPFPPSATRAPP